VGSLKLRRVGLPVLSGVAFLLAALTGLWVSRTTDGIAALWPANAILLAALLLVTSRDRWWHLAACMVASLAANLIGGSTLLQSLLFTAANLATVLIADVLLRRASLGADLLERPDGAARFVATVFAAVTVGATIVAGGLAWDGASFNDVWWSWASSDFLGCVLITSVILTVARHRSSPDETALASWRGIVLHLALLTAGTVVVFSQSLFPLLFVPFALLMLVTFRLGLIGAVLGTGVIAVVGATFLSLDLGPVALIAGSSSLQIRFFQFYLAVTFGTVLPLAMLLTERARLAQLHAESARRHQRILDRSREVIFETDVAGRWTYLNPAWEHLVGHTAERTLGSSFLSAILPEDRGPALERLARLYAGEVDECSQEIRYRHADGSVRWASVRSHLLTDAHGRPVGTFGTLHDVTSAKQAEQERAAAVADLLESNRLLLMAEEMARVGHWRFDVSSGALVWSDVVCAIHGREPGSAPPIDEAMNLYHPDDRAMVQAKVEHALQHGTEYAFHARLLRPDGQLRYVVAQGRPELGPDGSVTGLVGVFQDVTEAHEADVAIRQAGEQILESNRMLTMAETVARLGHWRIDTLDGVHFWSDEVYRIHGLEPDEQPGFEDALTTYHPEDRERVRAIVEEAIADARSYSYRARLYRPDGGMVHVFVRGEMDCAPDGRVLGVFGIIQDVSAQAEAEELLRAREERFRLITEQASDMISVHDFDGACRFMSPAARTILGYDPDDLLGHSLPTLVDPVHRRRLLLHRARLERNGSEAASVRFRLRHADGHWVWMEATSRQAMYDGDRCLIAVCRDVSDAVAAEAELLAARQDAEAAARAKSLFLANMSHEIRTPMNGVVGFTELLLASELSPEQRRQAELVADSGKAMMRLLNDILDLSKIEAGQMGVVEEPFDLHHALAACVKLVTPAVASKGLELRCEIGADVPKIVVGDGLRLRQIILNLLGNAAKFTDRGTIILRAQRSDDRMVAIAVEDSGIGISSDRQHAIFGEFVQADSDIGPRFGGTGLGLSISAQLATLMGGSLSVASTPGRGSTFTLLLPAVASDEKLVRRAMLPEPLPVPPTLGEGRVLVAEDHDVNQMLMADMLKQLGVAADFAIDGEDALAKVNAAQLAQRPYRLVLMDMQMPRMDGLEATRRLRASGMDVPIVALTANAYADDVAECLAAGMQAHLSKPVSLVELQATLARWMTAPARASGARPRLGAAVHEKYRARKADALQRLDALVRRGTFNDAELTEVADALHKLAGTAGMFGEDALGDHARTLEHGIAEWSPALRADKIRSAVAAIKSVA
jgi:PAS domain S-box-containing protein